MLRPFLFCAATIAVFIFSTAFIKHSKTTVSGEGVASGNISFAINADAGNGHGQIRYGDVTANIQSVAISMNGKMATIYFGYRETILGVTVIDGKKRSVDQISDPFPADNPKLNVVVPRLSYNEVTSGEIQLR